MSYSQNGEDRIIPTIEDFIKEGFFLDYAGISLGGIHAGFTIVVYDRESHARQELKFIIYSSRNLLIVCQQEPCNLREIFGKKFNISTIPSPFGLYTKIEAPLSLDVANEIRELFRDWCKNNAYKNVLQSEQRRPDNPGLLSRIRRAIAIIRGE